MIWLLAITLLSLVRQTTANESVYLNSFKPEDRYKLEPFIVSAESSYKTARENKKTSRYSDHDWPIYNKITNLHKEQKRTIVLITHEKYISEQAERIIYLRNGEIVKDERTARN